jgi:hypothetical protein
MSRETIPSLTLADHCVLIPEFIPLHDMIMVGRQCHSQRTSRPTTRTNNTTNAALTTVYGTEILNSRHDDDESDTNVNAVGHDEDPTNDAYANRFDDVLTPLLHRNRPCLGRLRNHYQQPPFAMLLSIILVVGILSISFLGSLWHVVLDISTTARSTTSSQTSTARLHYHS